MGFLNKIFKKDVDKYALIKQLAKQRIRSDPFAKAMGVKESEVDKLSKMHLMGLPEATIVSIVETWASLRKEGTNEGEIFQLIEEHRKKLKGGHELPDPINLESYIKYRVKVENESGSPVYETFIDDAIEICKAKFL